MKTSVVIPVLYQEPQLAETLRNLVSVRDSVDLEILVVVDVPEASRADEARNANDPVAERFGATAIYRVGERGFGSALRYAFTQATGEAVIPFMGDLSDDPRTIPRMIEKLDDGFDVVAGSRYMRGGGIVGNTAKQRLSHIYSVLLRMAGGPKIHDVSNAFKAYRRTVLQAVETVAESFDISVELTVKAARAGFRIGEVPTVWTNRELGTSNFHFGRELRNYRRWLLFVLRGRRQSSGTGVGAVTNPPGGTT